MSNYCNFDTAIRQMSQKPKKEDVYKRQIISTVIVICVLPSLFIILDKVICSTSIGFGPKRRKENVKAVQETAHN